MSDGTPEIERSGEFLSAVFHGDRFRGGRLPLEFGADLAALHRLIVDVARELYLAEHPDRRRVPKGFAESTALSITAIHDGSATVVVERIDRSLAIDDRLDEARDTVLSAIASASTPTIDSFAPQFLNRFNAIGRSLERDEQIMFVSPRTRGPVVYNKIVRARLAEQSAGVEDAFVAVGALQAVNSTAKSFQVLTAERLIEGRYRSDLDGPLRRAMAEGTESGRFIDGAQPVRVDGVGTFRAHSMVAFDAERVSVVEFAVGSRSFREVTKQLRELTMLEAGWLDGEGESVPELLAERALRVFASIADADLPAPHVFPTSAGGISAEWTLPASEVVLEFHSTTPQFYAYRRKLHTAEVVELPLDDSLNPSDVAESVAELFTDDRLS